MSTTVIPDESELDRLRAEVLRLAAERDSAAAERDAATAALAKAATKNAKLEKKVSQLEHKLEELLRKISGRSSEKIDPEQILMDFAKSEEEQGPPAPPHVDEAPDGETPPKTPRKKREKGGWSALPAHLPRVPIEHEPDDADLVCGCCGGARKSIGSPEITERLDYKPSSTFVAQHIRHRFRCPTCQDGTAIAPLPAPPLGATDPEKGRAEAGLLAYVVTSKFGDHLPLHRLVTIFEREGVTLHRSTLCDWVRETAALLWPIAERVRHDVVSRHVVGVDDTGVRVVYEKDDPRTGTRRARIWVYRGLHGEAYFTISDTKCKDDADGPAGVLAGFKGFVQVDAAGSYEGLFDDGTRLEVGCHAHARRKFFEARVSTPREAAFALAMYRKVYEIEARLRDATPEARRAARQAETKPLLDAFEAWLDEFAASPSFVPGTPLATAIVYARNQRVALRRFLDDGQLSPDNNAVERALRPVAVGRKSWLFAGSGQAAKDAATLYTLVVSCKEIGVEPWAYLHDVIRRRAADRSAPVEALTPRAWCEARRAVAAAASTPPAA